MAEHQDQPDLYKRVERIVDPNFTPEEDAILVDLARKLGKKVGFKAIIAEFEARISYTGQPMRFQQSPEEPQVQKVAPDNVLAKRFDRFLTKYEGLVFYPAEAPLITCKEIFQIKNVEIQTLFGYKYVDQKLYNIRRRAAL